CERIGDGRRHTAARGDRRQPQEFRGGELRTGDGDYLRRGRESAVGRGAVRARGDVARPDSPAAGVAGRVAPEHHVRAEELGRAARDDATARGLLRAFAVAKGMSMKLLLVGHGKVGRLGGELAPQYGFDIAGIIDPLSPLHGGGPDDPKWSGVDVAVDFTTPDVVAANASVLARRGISLVIGTTGWSKDEA